MDLGSRLHLRDIGRQRKEQHPTRLDAPLFKRHEKLALFERLAAHAAELLKVEAPIVLAGGYNVAPTEADIWPSHHEQENALLQPETRAAFERLLDQGWTDALRLLNPQGPLWTFWGYLRHRWPNDKGMRLDHLLVSPALAKRVSDAGVDRNVGGIEGASDHAPA